jgi:predicted protein tyrosine phosphatase
MPLQRIMFVPRAVAQYLPPAGRALISVHDPEDGPMQACTPWTHRLTLSFEDADAGARQLFSVQQAQAVLRFADEVKDQVDELVVHCLLGQSRSGAIALYLAEKYQVPLYKHEMPVDSSYALYNRYVYRKLSEAEHGPLGAAFGDRDDA